VGRFRYATGDRLGVSRWISSVILTKNSFYVK
jgi:hypothetical protein